MRTRLRHERTMSMATPQGSESLSFGWVAAGVEKDHRAEQRFGMGG